MVPGGGVEPPRCEAPADFESEQPHAQVSRAQYVLQLAFAHAARAIKFGVVTSRPVEHTLRTVKSEEGGTRPQPRVLGAMPPNGFDVNERNRDITPMIV